MGVNPPTAYLLLTDIVRLPRGSWVIHNGANSGVGRVIVAIAKSLGFRTVNVVRRDEVVEEIRALGGDVVLMDGPDLAERVVTPGAGEYQQAVGRTPRGRRLNPRPAYLSVKRRAN